VAGYAAALESATGRSVDRCVLVFVGDGAPTEITFQGEALAAARVRAIETAGTLVSG
jgi:hypothetical protein